MDIKMESAIEEFITKRVNDCSGSENSAIETALSELIACSENLKKTLLPEQEKLFRSCKNAYSLVEGEDHAVLL